MRRNLLRKDWMKNQFFLVFLSNLDDPTSDNVFYSVEEFQVRKSIFQFILFKTQFTRLDETSSFKTRTWWQQNQLYLLEEGISYLNKLRTNYYNYHSAHSPKAFIEKIGYTITGMGFLLIWIVQDGVAKAYYGTKQANRDCIEVDSQQGDCEKSNILVCMSGNSFTNDILEDNKLGIREINSIKLERVVEMLQWSEIRTKRRICDRHKYSLNWSSDFINSSTFHEVGHENDLSKWIHKSETSLAPFVQLGRFYLSDSLKLKIKNTQRIQLNEQNFQYATRNFVSDLHPFISLQQGYIYLRQGQQESQGDLRVSILKVPYNQITLVSGQNQNTFYPYICEQIGHDCGSNSNELEIDWIYEKIMTKKQVFQDKLFLQYPKFVALVIFLWLLTVINFLNKRDFVSQFQKKSATRSNESLFLLSLAYSAAWTISISSVAWLRHGLQIGLSLLLVAIVIIYLIYLELPSFLDQHLPPCSHMNGLIEIQKYIQHFKNF